MTAQGGIRADALLRRSSPFPVSGLPGLLDTATDGPRTSTIETSIRLFWMGYLYHGHLSVSRGFGKYGQSALYRPLFLLYNRVKSRKETPYLDNYTISRDRAQQYFLKFDQDQLIQNWRLPHDQDFLYVRFLHRDYRICRTSGYVTGPDGQAAGFSEVLSIFDLLCHEGSKTLSGQYAPVNSLRGMERTGGVGIDFHSKYCAAFDEDPAAFRRACETLGGIPVPMGDIGYRFPVFGDFSVILKFYRADEDFPASATLLWDANTLQYLFYETTFYIAGHLMQLLHQRLHAEIPG